jgi:hypothetical protein
MLSLHILSASIGCLLVYWIRGQRTTPTLLLVSSGLMAASLVFLPGTFALAGGRGQISDDPREFSEWRNAIPAESNVLLLPSQNSAKFAWFTLERPSYLTVDQSSGVVFSRSTALEVRRRSQVLLPLMYPDWMLLSDISSARGGAAARHAPSPPLTRERLLAICTDPELNFVVAREDVGFEPIRHLMPGRWRNWNLYDCARVKSDPR